jgi:hypothetical protein
MIEVFGRWILESFDDFIRKSSMNQSASNQWFVFEAFDDFNHCPQLVWNVTERSNSMKHGFGPKQLQTLQQH